jgi:hypothetical protein
MRVKRWLKRSGKDREEGFAIDAENKNKKIWTQKNELPCYRKLVSFILES